MTVYVDNWFNQMTFRHTKACWSHLFADTAEELDQFCRHIYISRKWILRPGTHSEHYLVTEKQRMRAILAGAVAVSYDYDRKRIIRRKIITATSRKRTSRKREINGCLRR